MELAFSAAVFEWRGPAPFYFLSVPEAESAILASASESVTYGWGMIPVAVRIGRTSFTTSLWPRGDGYVVPLKAAVRNAETIDLGAVVEVRLTVGI